MTWIEIVRGLAVVDLKHIMRERFLVFVLLYAVFLAAVVRFAVPPLTTVVLEKYGLDLVPYYGLISSFTALTVGSSMVGIVLGFLLLDARETRVLDAVSVTPLTFDRFLAYRVAMPMVVAVALNPACALISGIGLPALGPMLAISVLGVVFAGIGCLALATFADNKVQAFAVMKIISGVSMIPMAGYFIAEPWQYAFGLFPPYWVFKAWWVAVQGGANWWVFALVGVVTNVAFLLWMKRRFERAVHRG